MIARRTVLTAAGGGIATMLMGSALPAQSAQPRTAPPTGPRWFSPPQADLA